MTRLELLKEEIAFEKEQTVWNKEHPLNPLIDEVAKRYAQQYIDANKELEDMLEDIRNRMEVGVFKLRTSRISVNRTNQQTQTIMRQIKFRRAFFFDEECTQFSHYSEWGVKVKPSEFRSPSCNNFAPYYIDYQFTSLKDKNGTEIYEGDQFAPDTDNEEVKSVVRWDETFSKFVVDSYGYNYHIGEGSQEVYYNELSICDTSDLGDMILEYCEVIGNIYTAHDKGKEESC